MKKIFFILFILISLSACSDNYVWGWYVLNPKLESGYTNIRFLISGLYVTILISLLSIFFSLIVGLVISLLSLSKYKSLKLFNRFYIEIIRSIPILVMLLWVYYGLPIIFEINPRFSSTVAFRHRLGFRDFVWSVLESKGLGIEDYVSVPSCIKFYRTSVESIIY